MPSHISFPEIDGDGFTIIPGPFHDGTWTAIVEAYDLHAARSGGKQGSTSFRTASLLGTVFDRLTTHPAILKAASQMIGPDFHVSALHGRTLLPGAGAPPLHQDYPAMAMAGRCWDSS